MNINNVDSKENEYLKTGQALRMQTETLDTNQVSLRLNLKTRHYVSILINRNVFPRAFKDSEGRWRIPHRDIEEYERKSNLDGVIGSNEAAKILGKSRVSVADLIYTNQLLGAYKFGGKWLIPIKAVEEYLETTNTDGYLDAKHAAERLGYKSAFSIIQLINKSILPNGIKINNKWRVPLTDIEDLEKEQSNSFNTTQAAQTLEIKLPLLLIMIRNNVFPGAYKDRFSKWRIIPEDIEAFKLKRSDMRLLNPLNLNTLHAIEKKVKKAKNKKIEIDKEVPKKQNCLDITEVSKLLKINNSRVRKLINKRKFPGAFKYKKKWLIPQIEFDLYQKEIEQQEISILNSLSLKETAERLGFADKSVVSTIISKQKRLPSAYKVDNSWRIPLTDVEKFEKLVEESKKTIDYTAQLAFSEFRTYVDSLICNDNLLETKNLYMQYCLLQINNINGTNRYKRDRVLLFKRFFKKLISHINEDIFLISSEEITRILSGNFLFRKTEKKILVQFLNYAYIKKNIEPSQQFTVNTSMDKVGDKEIYSPKLFHEIYKYVKDIKAHIPPALNDRGYANMWVYTTLLLTDFIRGQDLILNTPNIDLETIGITSIDWFTKNELSEYQAQSIINQLYIHFRYQRASKTDQLLTFIVAPDLLIPLASSLIISELHRSLDKSEMLLETFLEGVFQNIKTSGKKKHQKFFANMKRDSEFIFSSRKLNRSVATYLFYSISEEEGNDSDLALHLTKVSRSHKNSDSTSNYIQATNGDGSINRVSYNLFKRGHFGWLYNYLILYVTQFEGTKDTLEERSSLIEQIRLDISPISLENIAKFVNTSLNPFPINRRADSMDIFIQNIHKKRQTVISKLKDYSKEEIQEILANLANGDLPSKNEHAQCLVFPNCKNPKLTNCFSCEYVIPGNLVLIQLNKELKRLFEVIENASNDIIIQRDTKFLMHALFIWKEARIKFGNDKVQAYISPENIWGNLEKIAHKLTIE